MAEPNTLVAGKWALGYIERDRVSILRLEFHDREPITLAIANGEAEAIAVALLDQLAKRRVPAN